MKRLLFGMLVLCAFAGNANASWGYRSYGYSSYYPSYSYSYPSYSYSYPRYYDVPVYKYIYKEYPIARYVDIYPLYGQLYFGPGSAAAYAAAVNAQTVAKAASTVATQASGTANAASTQLTSMQNDLKSLLSGVKGLTDIVSAMNGKVNSLEARMAAAETEIRNLKTGTPPVSPPKPAPDPKTQHPPGSAPPNPVEDSVPTAVNALQVTIAKCALCHKEGGVVRGKLILITKDGKRAPLSADQTAEFTRRVTEGSMPTKPKLVDDGMGGKKYDHNIKPLTNDETLALLMDLPNYPKKETKNEEVLQLVLPRGRDIAPARKLRFPGKR